MKRFFWFLPLLLFLALPTFVGPYHLYVVNLMMIYAIISVGLNVLYGYSGQISLGHGAFVGIGAYSTAILLQGLPEVPYPIIFLLAGLISLGVGILVAIPSFRLTGYYLALATMAFSLFVEQVLMQWKAITKGPSGISVPSVSILSLRFDSDLKLFYPIAFTAFLLILFARNLLITRTGRAFIAIRDHEVATQMMGISTAKYKTIAFSISAVYAGLGGALYVPLVKYVYPTTFGLNMSLFFLIMVILGGKGSVAGSILGAVLLAILPEVLSETKHLLIVVQGAILVLVVIFMPTGLMGFFRALGQKLKNHGEKLTGKNSIKKGGFL